MLSSQTMQIGTPSGSESRGFVRRALSVVLAGAFAVILSVPGCSRDPDAAGGRGESGEPVRVVVSIPPLAGLVRGLVPDDAVITVLVPPGRSAHGIELAPSDVAAIGNADLVIVVGAGLDTSVERVAKRSAQTKLIDFSRVIGLEGAGPAHDHDHEEHAETDDHDHDHAGPDLHVWLDPTLCEQLVVAVGEAMSTPAEAVEAKRSELRALDAELQATLAPVAGRSIVTHHDSFSRFASRYGFTIAAVVRPLDSVEPTPGELARTAQAVRDSGAAAILSEPQMPPGSAQRLAELTGARAGMLDPLGSGDYFAMMRANAAELVRVLVDEPAGVPEPVGP